VHRSHVAQFEAFLNKNPAEDDEEVEFFAKASAVIEKNRQWVAMNLDGLHDWLLQVLVR
jgi:hypothetical protein